MPSAHTDEDTLDALAMGLLRTGSPLLFATAGKHLSELLVRGEGSMPAAAERLLDAMERRLGDVRRAMIHQRHEPLRIELSTAAAALGMARPAAASRALRAIEAFLYSVGPAAWTTDPALLAERTLLSLVLEDTEAAARCVQVLLDKGDDRTTPWLYRWTLARLTGADAGAEARSWRALQSLARRTHDVPAGILVAAAMAIRLRSEAARPARAITPMEVPALT